MNWLAKLKTIMCRIGVPMLEFCHECGCEQSLVWWCDSNEVYEAVAGSSNRILCPMCFDRLASLARRPMRFIAVSLVTPLPTPRDAMVALAYLGDNPKLEIRNLDDNAFKARVVCGSDNDAERPWLIADTPEMAIVLAMANWDFRIAHDLASGLSVSVGDFQREQACKYLETDEAANT